MTILGLLLLAAWASSPAWALCIGPEISVNVTTAGGVAVTIKADPYPTPGETRPQPLQTMIRGDAVSVNGSYFTDGCHDVCINGRCPPTYPAKGIRLLFVQGDKTVQLAAVDADSNFGFSRRAFLPAGAINGPAAIVAETLYEGHWLRTRPVSFVVRTTR